MSEQPPRFLSERDLREIKKDRNREEATPGQLAVGAMALHVTERSPTDMVRDWQQQPEQQQYETGVSTTSGVLSIDTRDITPEEATEPIYIQRGYN